MRACSTRWNLAMLTFVFWEAQSIMTVFDRLARPHWTWPVLLA